MVTVLIYTESRFPADRKKIREFVETYLSKRIKGDVEIGVSIVGDRKMKYLNTTYRQIPETTDVLSFPLDDASASSREDVKVGFSPDRSSPDKILRLGDVVVSYPQTVMEASQGNKMVDQQLSDLIAHGLDHLMGIHHE
ncbi:MAG: rRNA maturation RNase YbeY [Patescibacteria group bacterium]